jgi:hypothetical protein
MVGRAARIERRTAFRTGVIARQILVDRQFRSARAADYGTRIVLVAVPLLQRVIGEGVMAVLARVVLAAAAEFDGDDVQIGVVVGAAGLGVCANAQDLRADGRGMAYGHIER